MDIHEEIMSISTNINMAEETSLLDSETERINTGMFSYSQKVSSILSADFGIYLSWVFN